MRSTVEDQPAREDDVVPATRSRRTSIRRHRAPGRMSLRARMPTRPNSDATSRGRSAPARPRTFPAGGRQQGGDAGSSAGEEGVTAEVAEQASERAAVGPRSWKCRAGGRHVDRRGRPPGRRVRRPGRRWRSRASRRSGHDLGAGGMLRPAFLQCSGPGAVAAMYGQAATAASRQSKARPELRGQRRGLHGSDGLEPRDGGPHGNEDAVRRDLARCQEQGSFVRDV